MQVRKSVGDTLERLNIARCSRQRK